MKSIAESGKKIRKPTLTAFRKSEESLFLVLRLKASQRLIGKES